MYLRVKKAHNSIAFCIVESYRDDEKKPRQRFIKHLGQIPEEGKQSLPKRYWFWKSIEKRVSDFSPGKAKEYTSKIKKYIPRPTNEEIREYRAEKLRKEYINFILLNALQSGISFKAGKEYAEKEAAKPEEERYLWKTFLEQKGESS